MAVKFEYTGKLSDGRYFDSDSTKRVTVELDDNDLNVNEMLEEFMNFMKAIGYNFDLGDHLEVVNDFKNNKDEWRWVETVLTDMLNNPAINGIVANSRDVTDRVNADIEKNLLSKISIAFNEESLLENAIKKCVRLLHISLNLVLRNYGFQTLSA